MSAASSRSEASAAAAGTGRVDRLASVRARAGLAVTAGHADGLTRLVQLSEFGGYRVKFPDPTARGMEAAILNTGGGVVGGDRISFTMTAEAGAHLTVASATAERVYRSAGSNSEVSVKLRADAGASLAWLPQATILFSGSRLERRITADIGPGARLLVAEATVLGRIASGEVMGTGHLSDTWRIRRDGRLVFADTTRIDGDVGAIIARPAALRGMRGAALLVCLADGIEERLDAVRAAIEGSDALAGASAWNGMLVLRALASGLEPLQTVLQRAISALPHFQVPQTWPH